MIPGGYYIKARKIQESDIAHAPPHVREIWDLLLLKCSHQKREGDKLERGQCLISYKDIQENLSWYVGWRKEVYSKDHCETAMKWLKKATMITTRKTARGMIVIVCNYDYYQNPENYENHTENLKRTTRKPHKSHTKGKNERIKEEEYISQFDLARKQFPGTKRGLKTEFENIQKKHEDWIDVLPLLLPSIQNQINHRSNIPEGKFIPEWKNFQTWINNRCWEEEHPINNYKSKPEPERPERKLITAQ